MSLAELARATRVALVAPGRTEVLALVGGRLLSTRLLHGHGADLARCNPDLRPLSLDRFVVLLAPAVRIGGAYLYPRGATGDAFLTVGRHTLCVPGVRPRRFRDDCARAGVALAEL